MKEQTLRRAFVATIPVLTGYIVLGIGFGILLIGTGCKPIWAILMSAFVYAGSMQYLSVNLLCGGASLITFAVTTLMVNARHLFYGISMIDKYKNAGKIKPYLILALTDETYSLLCASENESNRYKLYVSLLDHIYWVFGTAIGAFAGQLIKFDTTGIDFALTALFMTVLTDQWLKTKDHTAALIGIIASIVCLLIFGRDNFLIPAMLLITALLLVWPRVSKKVKRDE